MTVHKLRGGKTRIRVFNLKHLTHCCGVNLLDSWCRNKLYVHQSQVKPHSYFDKSFGQRDQECLEHNESRSCQSIRLSTA